MLIMWSLLPSWHAMQLLLYVLHTQFALINMSYNASKTICMMFKLKNRNCVTNNVFPLFKIGENHIHLVSIFKYLSYYYKLAK